MTQTTYSHIKQLIENSGVFHPNRNAKQAYQSFDFSNETTIDNSSYFTEAKEKLKSVVYENPLLYQSEMDLLYYS